MTFRIPSSQESSNKSEKDTTVNSPNASSFSSFFKKSSQTYLSKRSEKLNEHNSKLKSSGSFTSNSQTDLSNSPSSKKKNIFYPIARAKHSFYFNHNWSSDLQQANSPVASYSSQSVSNDSNFPKDVTSPISTDLSGSNPSLKSPSSINSAKLRASRSFFRFPKWSRKSWNPDVNSTTSSPSEVGSLEKAGGPLNQQNENLSAESDNTILQNGTRKSSVKMSDLGKRIASLPVVKRPPIQFSISSDYIKPVDKSDQTSNVPSPSSSVGSLRLYRSPSIPNDVEQPQPQSSRSRPRSSTIPTQRTLERLRENRSSIFSFRTLRRDDDECVAQTIENSALFSDIKPNPTKFLSSVPELTADDTAESYLSKLRETVPYSRMIPVLAEKDHVTLNKALHLCMSGMEFENRPLDFCLRLFLLKSHLPKETQQIDRVINAFSKRYFECNPGMFSSQDQCYILVFSLMMLHTDVFNSNNKHKMTKQEFINLCDIDELAPEIMEYYYDNITFTPFVNLDDELLLIEKEKNEKYNFTSRKRLGLSPYTFTLENQLNISRPEISLSYDGKFISPGIKDIASLLNVRKLISSPAIIQLVSKRSHPMAFSNHFIGLPDNADPGLVDFSISMLGILPRCEKKRRSVGHNSYKEHLVLLTASRILFFRNLVWAKDLMAQKKAYERRYKNFTTTSSSFDTLQGIDTEAMEYEFPKIPPLVFTPPLEEFSPDTSYSLVNAFAYCDRDKKNVRNCSFTVIFRDGSEETLCAPTEESMIEWVAKINYISTLRTAGLRMPVSDSYHPKRDFSCYPKYMEEELAAIEAQMKQDMEIARARTIKTRIDQLETSITEFNKKLMVLQRNAKNLSTCAPLQPKTRVVILQALKKVDAKAQSLYLEIRKMESQLQVLRFESDLDKCISLESSNDIDDRPSSTSPSTLKNPSINSINRQTHDVEKESSDRDVPHLLDPDNNFNLKGNPENPSSTFFTPEILSPKVYSDNVKDEPVEDIFGFEDTSESSPGKPSQLRLQIEAFDDELADTASLGSVTTCLDQWQTFSDDTDSGFALNLYSSEDFRTDPYKEHDEFSMNSLSKWHSATSDN